MHPGTEFGVNDALRKGIRNKYCTAEEKSEQMMHFGRELGVNDALPEGNSE